MISQRFWNSSRVSRSTWACELKYQWYYLTVIYHCHAPRERVSWNNQNSRGGRVAYCHAPRERVSWNIPVFSWNIWRCSHAPRERVSWNTFTSSPSLKQSRHAPRERVSWNRLKLANFCRVRRHAPRERVSWNFHECGGDIQAVQSRSTWACELKSPNRLAMIVALRHAPRERVSWNLLPSPVAMATWVTLHVSVWVEMTSAGRFSVNESSRSTWACELKYS